MNSRRISQNKKLVRIGVTMLICVSVLMLLPRVVNVAVSMVVAPINHAKTWVAHSGNSLPQYFRNRSDLIDEILDLQAQIAASSGDHYTAKAFVKENSELRSLLGDSGEERVLAGIIGRPGSLPYDSLMIDQGTVDGVVTGAPVYIGENTVIGVVKNATLHTALVELITTVGFSATVYIIGPDIYTNAVGIGGGQLRVGVPQGILLQEGDSVVLPSITSGIYGTISLVQSEPSRPEQYGYVSPKIPLASMRLVAVGKTPVQNITFEEAQEILKEIKTTAFTVPVPDEILVDTDLSTTSSSTPEVIEQYEE